MPGFLAELVAAQLCPELQLSRARQLNNSVIVREQRYDCAYCQFIKPVSNPAAIVPLDPAGWRQGALHRAFERHCQAHPFARKMGWSVHVFSA